MTSDPILAAVEANDPDGLLRIVDALVERRDWEELHRLRELALEAVERGKQLWGVAAHADHRLALHAPGPWAARAVVEGNDRFTPGPLAEVAASSHPWEELDPHLPPGLARTLVAHERVMRGEDLRAAADLDPHVLEVPFVLAEWEPVYPVATYRPDKVETPEPDHAAGMALPRVDLPDPGEPLDDPVAVDALMDLTRAWVEESNGRAEAVAVVGDAASAVAALGPRRVRMRRITPQQALARMAWTAASGGVHGRRRGMAPGRAAAWWAVAALAGETDEWPAHPDVVGEAAHRLRWYAWDDLLPKVGWSFHLAAEDPDEGIAWAATAVDAA